MIIMVINSGSSSLKYQLFNMENETVLAKGLCERIGIDGVLKHSAKGRGTLKAQLPMENHQIAMEKVMYYLTSAEHGVLKDLSDIHAVGHRVGHGGEYFSEATRVDERVKDGIRACIPLAPLHNPAAIMGIEACETVLGKNILQVVVCDTAFHQTMPKHAITYSIPKELREKRHIRRYGFHGTSHQFVATQAAKYLNKNIEDINIITCHLGNGSSLAAVQRGKSIDTTMGFTSLEGIVMGTRCGDLDPALTAYLIREEGMSAAQVEEMLYKKSGLLGISGVSPDLRDILEEAKAGNADAQNAVDVLTYQIKKYIGAYMAAMGGADAIVFTAGIGENSPAIREGALLGLARMGIVLDKERNNAYAGGIARISADDSPIAALIVPTNEELVIASETRRILGRS